MSLTKWFPFFFILAVPARAQVADFGAAFDGRKTDAWDIFRPITPIAPFPAFQQEALGKTAETGEFPTARVQIVVPTDDGWMKQFPRLRDALAAEYSLEVLAGEPIPRAVERFAPTTPAGHMVVEIRVRASRWNVSELTQDPRVRAAWIEEPAPARGPLSAENLWRLAFAARQRAERVQGFVGFGVGPDCGAEGLHLHVRAHQPALWVYHRAQTDPRSLEAALRARIPELAAATLIFKPVFYGPQDEEPAGETGWQCFLPEGCGENDPFRH